MVLLTVCLWLFIVALRATDSVAATDSSEKDAELIERLERSLLTSFGLDERPKVDKSRVKVPPYMKHLYNQKVKHNLEQAERDEEESDEKSSASVEAHSPYLLANTVRSFTHSESAEDRFHPLHQMLLRFNISSIPQREELQGAEIRIMHFQHPSLSSSNPILKDFNSDSSSSPSKSRRWPKTDTPYLQRIRIYDVLRPAQGSQPNVHRLLDTRIIDVRASDTARLDVGPVLKRWLKKPHTNHGLFVEVVPLAKNSSNSSFNDFSHVRLRRSAGESLESEWDEHQPLLVVHTDDPNIKPRKRRSSSLSLSKRMHSHCRKYNLYVDFRKVDWNTWIVAPPGYDAFFCQGTCPFPLAKHMNATNHAVIQNIIHSRYPTRVPSACCVPIKHSAISMLYLDKDTKVVLKTYQDMIVESCGCQ